MHSEVTTGVSAFIDQNMKVPISKIDAARRQLETAIELFFKESDPISIHTLASAANEIIAALAKTQGLTTFMQLEMIKPEFRKQVRNKLTEAQNFFKHARTDPNELLQFETDITPFFIWESSYLYQQMTTHKPRILSIFDTWFYSLYPDLLNAQAQDALSRVKKSFPTHSRSQFYYEACKSLADLDRMRSAPGFIPPVS